MTNKKNKKTSWIEISGYVTIALGPVITLKYMNELALKICHSYVLKGELVCAPNIFAAILILFTPFLVVGILLIILGLRKSRQTN
jgi:hypothetical protein